MYLSKRQPSYPFAKIFLALALCLCQIGLLAQDREDLILFAISDEDNNRIEVVIPENGDPTEMVLIIYEGDDPTWEMPLRGNLQLEGQATKPTRIIVLSQDQNRNETPPEEHRDIFITDVSGSGTPPTGPPPPPPEDPPVGSAMTATNHSTFSN